MNIVTEACGGGTKSEKVWLFEHPTLKHRSMEIYSETLTNKS